MCTLCCSLESQFCHTCVWQAKTVGRAAQPGWMYCTQHQKIRFQPVQALGKETTCATISSSVYCGANSACESGQFLFLSKLFMIYRTMSCSDLKGSVHPKSKNILFFTDPMWNLAIWIGFLAKILSHTSVISATTRMQWMWNLVYGAHHHDKWHLKIVALFPETLLEWDMFWIIHRPHCDRF